MKESFFSENKSTTIVTLLVLALLLILFFWLNGNNPNTLNDEKDLTKIEIDHAIKRKNKIIKNTRYPASSKAEKILSGKATTLLPLIEPDEKLLASDY